MPEELNKIKTQIENLKPEDLESLYSDQRSLTRASPLYFIEDGIAIMQIEGVIQPRFDMWSWLFGGTSIEILTRDFKALIANDDVKAIVLDVDSPGGVCHCVQEFGGNLCYGSIGNHGINRGRGKSC